MIGKALRVTSLCIAVLAGPQCPGQAADLVKIGILNTSADLPVHIANEKGYTNGAFT